MPLLAIKGHIRTHCDTKSVYRTPTNSACMSSEFETQTSESAEPHLVNPALRRRLQQCYEHGTKLASQETYDFDYAHTLFAECVVKDPGNVTYIEAMLANLQRKYDNNKR